MEENLSVKVKIDGQTLTVPKTATILDAARMAGISIPTLCYLRGQNKIGACRVCMVEVAGRRGLVAACTAPVFEGIEVLTATPKVRMARKTALELLLSTHDKRCLSCEKNTNCELQTLCKDLGVTEEAAFAGEKPCFGVDSSSPHMVRDNNKCVLCRRCVSACENQHVAVIGANSRGFKTRISCAFEDPLGNTDCVFCGQCIASCPTGALREKDQCDEVLKALFDPEKYVVVQTAPSVRVALGEEFGLPFGTNVSGKMVAALRRLGFQKIFDTNFGADLTVMEEAHEFISRLKSGGPLPLLTSCSPGWVRFCELKFKDFLTNLSTCKSPQQMLSALVKTYFAEKMGINPRQIFLVSVMPCTAKKFEILRTGQASSDSGTRDTDVVLTTRELAKMLRRAGIDFTNLPDEDFDPVLGISSGAGAIFGATGGVMEAALRTVASTLGVSLENSQLQKVRGMASVKESTYTLGGEELAVAVVSGLKNAAALLECVRNGEKKYHFIEVMCCPGGCVNGGGQPFVPAKLRNEEDISKLRAGALYKQDQTSAVQSAHENPLIKTIYSEFLGTPGGERAHKLLHVKP